MLFGAFKACCNFSMIIYSLLSSLLSISFFQSSSARNKNPRAKLMILHPATVSSRISNISFKKIPRRGSLNCLVIFAKPYSRKLSRYKTSSDCSIMHAALIKLSRHKVGKYLSRCCSTAYRVDVCPIYHPELTFLNEGQLYLNFITSRLI